MVMPIPREDAASVRVDAWGWRYAGRDSVAVENVSFEIEPGERVLLLGASGAGKSTLLAAMAGVLGEDQGVSSGSLLVNGSAPASMRGQIGLVLQDPENQVILERVGDDVAFGCENLGIAREEMWHRVHKSLKIVGLDVALDRSTSALSGGQKQRLALAGVLAMEPGLVLLDEPTANLDPDGIRDLRQALDALVEENAPTMVIIEHRVEQWWDFATRIIVIGENGVLWTGAPDSVPADVANALRLGGVWLPGALDAVNFSPVTAVSSPALLSVQDLRAAHLRSAHSTDPLSFELSTGSIHALVGKNGVGKTATALTLGGLIPARAGGVKSSEGLRTRVEPYPRSSSPEKWASRQLVHRIGSVFQSPEHQFVSSTVRSELMVGPRAVGMSSTQQEARAEELLQALSLEAVAEAHPFTLSGGQKRRLSVATALATKPEVLILDEPTFGQDARTWQSLVALLVALRDEGHGIAVVTHDEHLVDKVADRITVLGGVR